MLEFKHVMPDTITVEVEVSKNVGAKYCVHSGANPEFKYLLAHYFKWSGTEVVQCIAT